MQKTRISVEIAAAILASLTALLTLPPLYMPILAIYITWGGTFLLGSPTLEGIKKMWPPIILGTSGAVLILILFQWGASISGGNLVASTLIDMAVLFIVPAILLYLGRLPIFSVVAAIFLAAASLFATAAGGYGPAPHNLFTFWLSATLMCCLGPVVAWATMKLTLPVAAPIVPSVEETSPSARG